MFVPVKELPPCIQSALSGVGYRKPDISVEAREKVSPLDGGGQGRRAFFVALNMATGESSIRWGSWGGANIFNQDNQVDLDRAEYPIPVDGCAIKGYQSDKIGASVYLNPANMAKLLPATTEELTRKEKGILYAYNSIKPGDYRREALARYGASESDVAAMVARGFLKANGRGTQITTAGKNALGSRLGEP